MGHDSRNHQLEPVNPSAKNTGTQKALIAPAPLKLFRKRDAFRVALVAVSILAATSCKTISFPNDPSKEAQAGKPKTSALHTDPELWKKAITHAGQNEAATFSPDGQKVYFISRDRLAHKQRQLYALDLQTQNERRLTFQDGDVIEVAATADEGSVFYTSTTDEIKERPPLLYPETKDSVFPTTEIYRIRPEDELHERWTTNPGFDGFAHVANEPGRGPHITISRMVGNRVVLYRSGLKTSQFELVLDRADNYLHSFTSLDRRAWRAWVEENNKSRSSRIVWVRRGQKQTEFVTNFYEVRNLHLWDAKEERGLSNAKATDEESQMLFTAKTSVDGPRQAFWMDVGKNCAMTMDLGPGEITSIDISHDQQKILWTLSQGSNAQVFIDQLIRPASLCQAL